MILPSWLKRILVALALLIGCFPIAVVITILASPFWSWFEGRIGIEAYGHSGPAEWCYIFIYGVLVCIFALTWYSKSGKY